MGTHHNHFTIFQKLFLTRLKKHSRIGVGGAPAAFNAKKATFFELYLMLRINSLQSCPKLQRHVFIKAF